MFSINIKQVGISAAFIISATIAGATVNGAAAATQEDKSHAYQCNDNYDCSGWRGGVYHRTEGGVNYFYGGGEELGYGNKPRKVYYKVQRDFQYNGGHEAPYHYWDY